MKTIILAILLFFSASSYSDSCTKIVKLDVAKSRIFVICPQLYKFDEKTLKETIRKIFLSKAVTPDEYEIYFVASPGDYTTQNLAKNTLVGRYYTHSQKMVIWPKIPKKKKIIQLSGK